MILVAYSFLLTGAVKFSIVLLVIGFAIITVSIYEHFFKGNPRVTQIIGLSLISAALAVVFGLIWLSLQPEPSATSNPLLSLHERFLAITVYMQSLPWRWIAVSVAVGFGLGALLLRSLGRRRIVREVKPVQDRIAELEQENSALARNIKEANDDAGERLLEVESLTEVLTSRDTQISEQKDRIKELEEVKAALERGIAKTGEQHRIEIGRLQHSEQTHSIRADMKQGLLAQYQWLHTLAAVQANDISDYVVVERLYFCYHELTGDLPFIVFGVDIFNKSVFNVTIENSINGHIEIAGKPLLRDKRFTHNPSKISPMSKGELTIEHRLSPEEAALIARRDKDIFGSFFYFDKLVVMIGGGTQFPSFERTQLRLPQFLGSNDTPAATEIASLKAQLEEEKAKNMKPDITGEIKEVFFESRFSPTSKVYDDFFYANFYFWIRVYVANHRATTTVKEFKFTLRSNGRQQDGKKETLEGWHVQRQTVKEELIDIEASNDVPLEHSRNGWLRFIVSDVQESGIRHTEDDPLPEMDIEIDVIDKDGTPHRLIGLPQSQWRENALWAIPRIAHITEG